MSIAARKIRLIMALRRSGMADTAVLGAIERVPREKFVPPSFVDQAYEDMPLPIGLGQTISQPLVVAMMTQTLMLSGGHRVLEIGTGCGYQTAVLAKLSGHVYTIERHGPLLEGAVRRFAELELTNVTARLGDGTKGWTEQAPFDRIMVTAAGGLEPPPALIEQMADDAILVIPLGGDRREQRVCRFTRTQSGLRREELWPVRFVPLLAGLPSDPMGVDAHGA
ncbi:MAG: protein-L-isoaspartate(D-aspartate) O-methyltransferase [Azospirillum sp.]|nr:protein-L-isoaspartate(D-aspartate) O-methyltransferase [Azospirillum sp.]